MEEKRIALLIDSDNVSSDYLDSILDEVTKYGVVNYEIGRASCRERV